MGMKKLKKLAEANWIFRVDNELFDSNGKSKIDKLTKRIDNLEVQLKKEKEIKND